MDDNKENQNELDKKRLGKARMALVYCVILAIFAFLVIDFYVLPSYLNSMPPSFSGRLNSTDLVIIIIFQILPLFLVIWGIIMYYYLKKSSYKKR